MTRPHGDRQVDGARKRKAIAEANAEKAKVEKERDERREALDIWRLIWAQVRDSMRKNHR